MTPRVSIIMPAYNVAEWVVRSITSALAQSEPNTELIIVDDASTDDTVPVVCRHLDSLPSRDSDRVRLIRRLANGGYGQALAAGLSEASGDWVVVHDADDTAHPEMLERLLGCVAGTDAKVATCRMRYVDERGTSLGIVPQWSPAAGLCSGAEALGRLARGQLNGFQANKIVHRSLWSDPGQGIDNIYADIGFTARHFSRTPSVAHCRFPLYNYTQRPGSVTGSLRATIWDLDSVSRTVADIFDQHLDPSAARTATLFFRYRQVYWPMLHKAAADSHSELADEVIRWVRARISVRELLALARHGDPGPVIMLTMTLAKLSPRLHDQLYRRYVEVRP